MRGFVTIASVAALVGCTSANSRAPGPAPAQITERGMSGVPEDLGELCRTELAQGHCGEGDEPGLEQKVDPFCTCALVEGLLTERKDLPVSGAAFLKIRAATGADGDHAFGLALRTAAGSWRWIDHLFTEERLRPHAPTVWEGHSLRLQEVVPGTGSAIVVTFKVLESDTRDETTTTERSLVCDGRTTCWELESQVEEQHCKLDCAVAGKSADAGDDCLVCHTDTTVHRVEVSDGKVRRHSITTSTDYSGKTTRQPPEVMTFPSLMAYIEAAADL